MIRHTGSLITHKEKLVTTIYYCYSVNESSACKRLIKISIINETKILTKIFVSNSINWTYLNISNVILTKMYILTKEGCKKN